MSRYYGKVSLKKRKKCELVYRGVGGGGGSVRKINTNIASNVYFSDNYTVFMLIYSCIWVSPTPMVSFCG